MAAYDGRLWVQELRNGVQCCWGEQRCEKAQEQAPRGDGNWAVD